MDTEFLISKTLEFVVNYGPKLIGALLVLIIGLYVIKVLTKSVNRLLTKRETAETLRPFIITLLNLGLKTMLVISVMGMVGVEMTSFVAILGAAGLAVGLALSGTLQNFAGGVMILIFKPFKAGDYIDAQGHAGIVKEIQVFNTILVTPDNKTIIIPNGGLSTGSMTNFSTEKFRRIEFTFGFAYGQNYSEVKQLLLDIIKQDDKILNEPAEPFVALAELADSSVNVKVRVWTTGADYWDVFFRMNEKVYEEFNKAGISIPFPQLDVHIQK